MRVYRQTCALKEVSTNSKTRTKKASKFKRSFVRDTTYKALQNTHEILDHFKLKHKEN